MLERLTRLIKSRSAQWHICAARQSARNNSWSRWRPSPLRATSSLARANAWAAVARCIAAAAQCAGREILMNDGPIPIDMNTVVGHEAAFRKLAVPLRAEILRTARKRWVKALRAPGGGPRWPRLASPLAARMPGSFFSASARASFKVKVNGPCFDNAAFCAQLGKAHAMRITAEET